MSTQLRVLQAGRPMIEEKHRMKITFLLLGTLQSLKEARNMAQWKENTEGTEMCVPINTWKLI